MSFFTSLSGLQAAQTEMATISHNLANVSTNGFKRSTTQFADVIASTSNSNPTQMVGSGTVVKSVRQQFSQGGFTQSSSALDVAISGEGFFIVKGSDASNNVSFTRNGSFLVDSDRYVVDAQGNKLQVYPVDGSGAVVATGIASTVSLRLPQISGKPEATEDVTLSLNLNANSVIPSDDDRWTDVPYAFDRFDPATYNHSAQTTIYDANGNALTLTTYFVRETTPTGTDPTSEWTAYSFVGDKQLNSGTDPDVIEPIHMTFDSTGKLTAPAGPTQFQGFLAPGATTEQMITLDFGDATTQVYSPFSIDASSQDGSPVGQLEGVTIGDDGTVRASFSNGDSQALGKVVLASFSNPTGLRQLGSSTWSASGLSGEPRLGEPGANGFGGLMSGAIERSNVDITEELVGLIAAQRNFQANAKALDTASQISQTIFNIRS
ncbi:flagellar hook protein FlgE [Sphingomonas psychrotolerans]|uniref:Flagellar hook protein FlgE n=1 Tax=Sphingomonas psychrotolerans TaxID=1327635 RepID=A0ABU3NB50_9SPHN|nr:flagellar hook protein FlgE [Sphingomonas psychrotolerans]MDT8760640.1 flagellar hook protein FlgE [Sphingomonas psychrotolerans]